jgi:hypothetical protein
MSGIRDITFDWRTNRRKIHCLHGIQNPLGLQALCSCPEVGLPRCHSDRSSRPLILVHGEKNLKNDQHSASYEVIRLRVRFDLTRWTTGSSWGKNKVRGFNKSCNRRPNKSWLDMGPATSKELVSTTDDQTYLLLSSQFLTYLVLTRGKSQPPTQSVSLIYKLLNTLGGSTLN